MIKLLGGIFQRTLIGAAFAVLFLSSTPLYADDYFTATLFYKGTPLSRVVSLDVSPNGFLYIVESQKDYATGPGKLFKINIASKVATTIMASLPLQQPDCVIVGDGRAITGQDLIIADHNTDVTHTGTTGAVLRVNPNTGAYSVLATGNPAFPSNSGDPSGLALGPGGAFGNGIYVMDFEGASSNPPVLYRINPNGSAETFLVSPSLWTTSRNPMFLGFDKFGDYGRNLFVSDIGDNGIPKIWRIDSARNLSTFYQGIQGDAFGPFAFGKGGAFGHKIYLAAMLRGAVGFYVINPDGTAEPIALEFPDGIPDFQDIVALAFSPDGSRMFFGTKDSIYEVRPNMCALEFRTDAELNVSSLNLVRNKKNGKTVVELTGSANVPSISLNGRTVDARVVLQLKGAGQNGEDLVISRELPLRIEDRGNVTIIGK